MVPDDYKADDSEFYYEGSLPVLTGRFRRKLVGYFNGNIPAGTRIGREVRLVKLPQLNWVFGYLLRDDEHGVVLYVPNGALLPGVEGFHPLRSGREIRQTLPITSSQPPHSSNSTDIPAANLDDNLDHLTDLAEIEGIDGLTRS
jgi:hypothetical protein